MSARPVRLLAAGFALVVIALSPVEALAAPPAETPVTEAQKDQARVLVRSGKDRRDKGALREALDDFRRAQAIMNVPTTSIEVARTLLALGMLTEGRAELLAISRSPARANDPPAFGKARAEAQQLADATLARLGTLTIVLRGARDASVTIDGVRQPKVDQPLTVDPGAHTIVAESSGVTRRATVRLAEGATETVELDFTASKLTPPLPPPPPREPEARGSRLNGFTLGGAAVLVTGATAGTITGLLSFKLHDDVRAQCVDGCPSSTDADVSNGKTLGTVSTIAFAVAGAGALLMLYGIVFPPRRAAAATSMGSAVIRF